MSSRKRNKEKVIMTDSLGHPVRDDKNSKTVGENGPIVLEDTKQIDKLASFNRERIPERVVHAKGAGAFGYFKLYKSMEKYTYAKLFTEVEETTEVFTRFSTVIGSRGSADTKRDPRGFAVKFYTKDGNYDIVGNHLPVFFIRDSIKFPDLIHSLKPAPNTNVTDLNSFWDFISRTPEACHMLTWLYSDRATIKSFRKIEGFGVNTYVWVNKNGDRSLIKYHWKPLLGLETIDRKEAEILAGLEPDIAVKDLYDTIESGKVVEYELYVQIMSMGEADKQYFNPLDATKTWPEDIFPLKKVGKMVLNKMPCNFFRDVEQAAFAPSNLIPGVEASRDKLLQGRLFAYSDAHRYRIGPNFHQLPVNSPKTEVYNNEQDGPMRYKAKCGQCNYNGCTLDDCEIEEKKDNKMPSYCASGYVDRLEISEKQENYRQAMEHYRGFTEEERDNFIDNISNDLWGISEDILKKVLKIIENVDKDMAYRIKKTLKVK